MECKCKVINLALKASKELIDTLWNVNKVALIESPAQK